ncbi:hypothetical protein OROMI_010277 [Orobanche minor]
MMCTMVFIILHWTTVMGLLFDGGAILAADTKTTIEIGKDEDPVNPLEGYEEAELPVGSIVDEEKTLNIGDNMVVAHIGNTGWCQSVVLNIGDTIPYSQYGQLSCCLQYSTSFLHQLQIYL